MVVRATASWGGRRGPLLGLAGPLPLFTFRFQSLAYFDVDKKVFSVDLTAKRRFLLLFTYLLA